MAHGRRFWGGVLVTMLGCLTQASWALTQAMTPLQAHRVSPSAWYVEGQSALGTSANQNFISNAAFVVTPDGVVVIDALGSPALAIRLLAAIHAVTPLPVTHVIVTHYHADHIYGLQTSLPIWGQSSI